MKKLIFIFLSILLFISCNVFKKTIEEDFDEYGITDAKVWLDSDGDGFTDDVDKCPDVAGILDGCPEVEVDSIVPVLDIIPSNQLYIEFPAKIIDEWEDLWSEPGFNDDEAKDLVLSRFNSLKEYNNEIIELAMVSGQITESQYNSYKTRINSGELFEADLSQQASSVPELNSLENENLEIVDITDNKPLRSSEGIISYNVPDEMQVGKEYRIKVRISKDTTKSSKVTLVMGEREIPIYDDEVGTTVNIESIRVEKTMSAELLGDDGNFKITPLSTEVQNIEDEGYTEWSWNVIPLKSGENHMKLIVKVKVQSGDDTVTKDIVVFDKDIKVKTNITYSVKSWFSKYWEWLISTIIIPLVIFFYKRRKKKKGEDVED